MAVGALLAVVAFAVLQGQAPGALTPGADQGKSLNQAVAQKPPGLLIAMSGIKPSLKSERVLENPSGEVSKVAFSPDGQVLATGSDDGSIVLWNPATGEKLQSLSGHSKSITALAFSPDGRTLVSAAWERGTATGLVFWDVGARRKPWDVKAHFGQVRVVAYSPDGKMVVSGSWVDETPVIFWNAETAARIRTIKGRSYQVHSLAFSRDGRWLATGSGAGAGSRIIFWDPSSGTVLKVAEGAPSGDVIALAAGAEDKTLVSLGGGRLTVWDVEAGKILRTLEDVPEVKAVTLTPDGRAMAFATMASDKDGLIKEEKGGVLHFRGIAEDTKLLSIEGVWFRDLAFAPDGRFLAAARLNTRTVMVLDTRGLIAFALMKDVGRLFRKEEFETTAEYQARVGDRTVPLDVPLALGAYDADKGAFEAELAGVKMAVSVPREMARGLSERRTALRFGGTLRSHDKDNVLLIDTYLMDGGTKIPVTVENVSAPEAKEGASKPPVK
jgi:WD40 repeat protein